MKNSINKIDFGTDVVGDNIGFMYDPEGMYLDDSVIIDHVEENGIQIIRIDDNFLDMENENAQTFLMLHERTRIDSDPKVEATYADGDDDIHMVKLNTADIICVNRMGLVSVMKALDYILTTDVVKLNPDIEEDYRTRRMLLLIQQKRKEGKKKEESLS